jgi:hypothetical protein
MLGPVYTIIVLRFFHMSCDLFPTTILQLYDGYLAKENKGKKPGRKS